MCTCDFRAGFDKVDSYIFYNLFASESVSILFNVFCKCASPYAHFLPSHISLDD